MKTLVAPAKAATDSSEMFGSGGASLGPAGIIRDVARDLLRQRRLPPTEAGPLGAALRDHDWTSVRAIIEAALRTSSPGAPAAEAVPVSEPAPASAPAPAPAPEPAPAPSPAGNAGDQTAAAFDALLRVVVRLCDALPRLTVNDCGITDRLAPVRTLLAGRLTPERIDEIDARLAAVVDQQVAFEQGLQEARSSVEDMLTLLVDRLATVGTSTARFQSRVQEHRQALAGSKDPQALTQVVQGLLDDTREVAEAITSSQGELAQARRQVESYEMRVRALEQQLADAARLVQNDPLTHTLNRRGLDEVFRVEMARATRYRSPLTIVMVDLDDFKAINDSLGHAGGDRALIHFVTTARACLRSTELIARTGGEEFVIALPATSLDNAVDAVRRLQRDLASSPFEFEGQQRVMSFSGGATAWLDGESLEQTLRRADAAMYAAKRAGKNRVVIAG